MTKSLITTAGILFILTAFIGCDNSASAAKSAEKSITSFSFTQALNPKLSASQVDGVIDETGKTITLKVDGNALPNLIATFSISAGAKLEVAGALQESGVTTNDFSNPVTYRVTAEDGSTEDYTVSVTAKSTEKSITSFSFTQALNSNLSASQVDGVIDESGKTITLKVNGNALPNLIATFSISAGAKLEVAGVPQESGVTSNNFSNPVTYRVTAEDGTTEDYTVSVQSTSKSITSFSFTQALNSNLSASQVDGVIDETGKTITLKVNGNALPNLIATFSISVGAKLEVAGTLQESGVTTNDFSNPVTYRVTAEDGTTEDYTVSVTAKSTEKSITSFSFTQALNSNLSASQVDGVIDETGKTIILKVKGNALPNLIATFSISAGAKLEVAGTLQESGVTTNDFSNPVIYRVTAEDGTTEDYTVSVQSTSKSITSFSFTQALNSNLSASQVDGVIDETGKTITLKVKGNALPNLIATFSISAGAKLEVAGVPQESGVTTNDFSNPVTYRVTAEDGSTEDYTVSVTAKSTEKSITSFSFTQALNSNLSASQVDGVIDETGKTITLKVNGNALPNLIATFSISAGAKLEVAGVPQESGVTTNDFTNPVTYRVTAEDGSTEDYTVSVTAKSTGKSILSFSFTQALNPNLSTTQDDGVINESGKTITLKVNGNALPNLIATFSISVGAKLEVAGTLQESGVTSNDFSNPVTYRVTAEDGSTEDYTVSVTPKSTEKSITSFFFTQALNPNLSTTQVDGVIDEPGKTITLQVIGNALPNLIATFSINAGAKLEVAGTLQESGVTSNDFSNPVTYRVTAEDGTTEDYTVSVTSTAAAPSSPSSPTGITGAKTGTGAGTVTITWDAPDEAGIGNDGNPAVITKYKLYRSEAAGFALTDAGVTTTEITDAALREYEVSGLAAASTEYYFKLTAFNSVGEGSPTDEFNAFTPTDGLAFTPINSDTEYRVAKGTVNNTATGIAVPAYYEGKEVTTLGANAFDGFSQLVSIQLPGGLTDIGSYAFRDCSSLALTSLPDGITAIGMYAFENCSSLALTSLPNGLTSIGTSTFYYCSSLALTSLPDGITSIEEEAFEGCSKLALTSLPDKLTTIYPFAFSACSSLALTSLPSGLTSIFQYAFNRCTGLTEIAINRSTPPTAGTEIFKGCTNLTKIKVPAANVDDYKTASGWDTYSDRIESI